MNEIYIIFLVVLIILVSYICYLNISLNKLKSLIVNINNEKADIKWPHLYGQKFNIIIDNLYDINHFIDVVKKEMDRDIDSLQRILEMLDEGVILSDSDNKVVHYNKWVVKHLNIQIDEKKNLLETTNNSELIDMFSDIINNKNPFTKQYKVNNRIINVNTMVQQKNRLITFHDVTEMLMYEKYKYELTGNITHELKTPVSLIMNYAETLLNDLEINKTILQKFLNAIYKGAIRLNNLINDIVELHRLESIGEDFDTASIEVTDLKKLIEEISEYYSNSGRTISFHNDVDSCKIKAEHLLSIVTNLVDNALKYTTGEITVDINRNNKNIIIAVSDCGPAIPSNERERIFERFYTTSHSKNMQTKGTGLGLSIVKHISKIYDGNAFVVENRQGGNTFIVELNG